MRWPGTVPCLRRRRCPGPGAQAWVGAHAACLHSAPTVADASLRAVSGGTWRAADSAPRGPLPGSGPRPPEDASWRRPEHGGGNELTSSRQAWGRGPGRGGAGPGAGPSAGRGRRTEGAALGSGQGEPVTAGAGHGDGGPPPGARSRTPARRGERRPCDVWCGSPGVQEQRRVAGGRGSESAPVTVQLPSTEGLAREEPWL